MTLKNIATLHQRSKNTENHNDIACVIWTLMQRCYVFQCYLNVDTTSLCFSVSFQRLCNVTMFFSVISTSMQRRYVFQCYLNVDTTSLCFSVSFQRLCNVTMFFSVISTFMQRRYVFSVLFERWCNVVMFFSVLRLNNITTLYQRWNDTEKHSDAVLTFKEHWKT
jgi:hypothetical protein